jgi:hypothetical protein
LTDMNHPEALDFPLSLVTPIKLSKQPLVVSCALFFPYRTNPSLGLVANWEGEDHLIHLEGDYAFGESAIDQKHPIFGAAVTEIEFRADMASRYNSAETWDPQGALVLKEGKLFLFCRRLGDRFHNDPYPVPLGTNYPLGSAEEACGFRKWSIAVRDNGRPKVIRSFTARTDDR